MECNDGRQRRANKRKDRSGQWRRRVVGCSAWTGWAAACAVWWPAVSTASGRGTSCGRAAPSPTSPCRPSTAPSPVSASTSSPARSVDGAFCTFIFTFQCLNQWCGVLFADFFHILPLLLLCGSIHSQSTPDPLPIHSQSTPDPLLKSIYSKNRHLNNRYLTIIDTTAKHRVLCIILARTIFQKRLVTPTSSVPHQCLKRLVNRKIAPSLFAMKCVFSFRARMAKNLPAGPSSFFFWKWLAVKRVSKKIVSRPRLESGHLKHSPIHSLKIDPIQSPSKSTPNLLHNTGINILFFCECPVYGLTFVKCSLTRSRKHQDWMSAYKKKDIMRASERVAVRGRSMWDNKRKDKVPLFLVTGGAHERMPRPGRRLFRRRRQRRGRSAARRRVAAHRSPLRPALHPPRPPGSSALPARNDALDVLSIKPEPMDC